MRDAQSASPWPEVCTCVVSLGEAGPAGDYTKVLREPGTGRWFPHIGSQPQGVCDLWQKASTYKQFSVAIYTFYLFICNILTFFSSEKSWGTPSSLLFASCVWALQYLRLLVNFNTTPSKVIPNSKELMVLVYLSVTCLVVTAYHHREQDVVLVTDMTQEVKSAERLLDSCEKEKAKDLN